MSASTAWSHLGYLIKNLDGSEVRLLIHYPDLLGQTLETSWSFLGPVLEATGRNLLLGGLDSGLA